jgi:hypothetical protein
LAAQWENYLKRWVGAGLIEPATAERIRAYEAAQGPPSGLRWPVLLAISQGGLLLGAEILSHLGLPTRAPPRAPARRAR